ncbi:MAG: peptidylprolyl isomerase [Chitinivibrionia bacterium]|nr:peptidylprolyl isomerase [Chitinivibrionia bacterium]
MAASLCIAGPLCAQKALVEKVVAVVEDEPIFLSELDQMVKQYMMQRGTTAATDAQRRVFEDQALEELIGNKLVLVQAKKLGLDVPFSDVERRVDQALEENRKLLGSEEAFTKQLEAEGLTLDELKQLYREQIRNRMLVERVLAKDIDRDDMQVGEAELQKSYEEKKGDFPKRPEVVHLASILFSFQSSAAAQAEARRAVEDILDKILGGMDFAEAAKKYSQDPGAPNGGDLGFMNPDDVQEKSFAEAALKLRDGEISPPVQTSFGFHLIQRVEKNDDRNELHLRHILVRIVPSDKDIESVFQKSTMVRELIAAGAPFDSLAGAYSDDEASASEGGDLGWLKVEDLPDFFMDMLRDMKPGDTSPVQRESQGFRIIRLLDREAEREYTFDEVKGELKKLLEQEKMDAIFEQYIQGLRKKFLVEGAYEDRSFSQIYMSRKKPRESPDSLRSRRRYH